MTWPNYFRQHDRQIMDAATMFADGIPGRSLREAVLQGTLIRVRRGHYALPGTMPSVLRAGQVGGRLACVSAALAVGIFGFDDGAVHVHVNLSASRLRVSSIGHHLASGRDGYPVRLHWDELHSPEEATECGVGLADIIRQIFFCQHHRYAMATLENALRLKRLPPTAIPEIFDTLPRSLRYLQKHVDSRADSGQESVLRLIVLESGFVFEFQSWVRGVGRVDLIVEGCIVVEADSRQFHDGWEAHARDRTRDAGLAALGFMSLRVLYRDIMFHPERIVASIQGLLDARHHARAHS